MPLFLNQNGRAWSGPAVSTALLPPLLPALPSGCRTSYGGGRAFHKRRRTRNDRPKAMNEQRLIEACQARDRDAQRLVYDRTVRQVHRLIYRMVGNADDAIDLTQQVYIRVFASIAGFRGECSLSTWVYRVAVNETLSFIRRRRTENRHVRECAVGILDRSEEPRGRDERMDVRAAIECLDEDERIVLLLRYDQGLDYRAIADLLDCAEGTVASRLNRARQRLRTVLQQDYGGGEVTGSHTRQTEGEARSVPHDWADTDQEGLALKREHRASGDGGR